MSDGIKKHDIDKPWYSHLTIDLLVFILQRSLLHPFIAWLLPLCLRAVATPYESPQFIGTCIYAGLITLSWMLGVIDHRVAHGLPRRLEWDEEVVVITGGASGLGMAVAEMYGMRGASVAVLDVHEAARESDGLAGVRFYRCDVGDVHAVGAARARIEEDLGTPTILINNAGTVNGKTLLNLTAAEIQKNFSANLLSHFHTLRAFLPGMLAAETGGTIVTVSSVLGKTGASHLSDYTAAKAGLIALHASLRAELAASGAPEGSENIRMILVTPGQLSTSLFEGVETPSTFFGPLVEPVELAREIVRMVDSGEGGEISLPFYARHISWLNILPAGLKQLLRQLTGIDKAMDGFVRADQGSPPIGKRATRRSEKG